MTIQRSYVRQCFVVLVALACLACGPEDDPTNSVSMPLFLWNDGGVVRQEVAAIPYFFTDTTLTTRTPAFHGDVAEGNAHSWHIADMVFNGAGHDNLTGSANSLFREISHDRINLSGFVFPWIQVVQAGQVDHPRNYRPMVVYLRCADDPSRCPAAVTPASGCRDFTNRYVCQDPIVGAGITNAFWDRNGLGPYSATNRQCPDTSRTGATAMLVTQSEVFCPWTRLIDDAVQESVLYSAALRPVNAVNERGAQVTTRYVRNAPSVLTMLLYNESFDGTNRGTNLAYAPAAQNRRGIALWQVAHEAGHAMGMNHQHQLACGSRTQTPTSWEYDVSKCRVNEYGNYNLMGFSPGNHPDPFTKLFLGATSPASLTTVTASGTYSMKPTADPTAGGSRFLRVSNNTGRYFYFDYRAAVPNSFDATLPPGMRGVVVHEAPDFATRQQACLGRALCSQSPQMLDLHPATLGNVADGAALVGDSFTDTVRGFTSHVVELTPSAAMLDVTLTSDNQNTRLFYFKSGVDRRTYTMNNQAGALTLQSTIGPVVGYTHVVGAPNSTFLYYNSNTGAAYSAHIRGGTHFPYSQQAFTLPSGYDLITSLGRGTYFLYNSTNGRYRTLRLAAYGVRTELADGVLGGSWTAVAGTLNGVLVLYDTATGRLETAVVGESGRVVRATSSTIDSGFTRIAAVREQSAVFYNAATGTARAARFTDGERAFSWSGPATQLPSGATSVAGSVSGAILLYRASTGASFSTSVNANAVIQNAVPVASPGAGYLVTSAGGF